MEITGTLKQKNEIETFGSGFQKCTIIVTTNEQYPQDLPIEFMGDKIDLPEAHKVGSKVKVGINLRSRSWTNDRGEEKHFPSIIGWRMLNDGEGEVKANTPIEKTPEKLTKLTQEEAFDEDGDLPF